LRSVDVQKSFYETNQVVGVDGKKYPEAVGVLPISDIIYGSSGTSGSAGTSGNSTSQSGTNATPVQGGTSGPVGTDPNTGLPIKTTADPNKVTKVEGGDNSKKPEMNTDSALSALKNNT